MAIQSLSNCCFKNAVNTENVRGYENTQNLKEDKEESIFKLLNACQSDNITSKNKDTDSEGIEFKESSDNKSSILSALETFKSILESLKTLLTSLTDKLTNKQDESKVNDNNKKTINKNSDGVTEIKSRDELLQTLKDEGYDPTLLRTSDLDDILSYNAQYKDGEIVCTDENGRIVKYYSITEEGQYCYKRQGDKFISGGRISHSLGYGQYYDEMKMSDENYFNDLTIRFYVPNLDKLKEKGFEFSC